jgi:ABC-type branched-subunit amino acid transport system permease subunit
VTFDPYWLNSIIIPMMVMGLAGVGLNLLMGYAGLVSLGSAAFMSVGAFTAYNVLLRTPLPLPLALLGAGVVAGAVGTVFGLPSLRIKGFYLAASTLGGAVLLRMAVHQLSLVLQQRLDIDDLSAIARFVRAGLAPGLGTLPACPRLDGTAVVACP